MKVKFILFILVFINCVHAQQDVKPVRLADCIMQALDKNPAIRVSQAKVQAAEARSSEAMTALLPQLKFTGRMVELSEVNNTIQFPFLTPPVSFNLFPYISENYSARLSLQQPVFTGFKLVKNREMAELNANATREDLVKDRSDLVLNVITAYWSLYHAVKVEEVVRQSVEQISQHLKDVSAMASQGLATNADVMKIQVQLSDIKVKHIEAKNAIRLVSMRFNSLLGNPLEMEVVPIDTPVTNRRELINSDLQSLKIRALERRPELKSMQLRRDMNSAGVSAAKGGWYPQVFLSANYDYSRPNQRIIPPKDRWDGTWDVGVTLQWNIWDWFATHYQTAQAEAALRQTEAGLTQVNDAVTLDVAQQYFAAQTANEKVIVASDGMKQAQESYRISSEKFKNGLVSNTDLLDAEMALLQAQLTHTQAEVESMLAFARLKKAIGETQ